MSITITPEMLTNVSNSLKKDTEQKNCETNFYNCTFFLYNKYYIYRDRDKYYIYRDRDNS